MKSNIKTLSAGILVGIFAMTLLSFTLPKDTQDDWVVPAKYKAMKNPYAKSGDEDGVGKDLFKKYCQSCHGKEGYGDGTKAEELDAELRDMSGKEVQSQADGELYYKSFIGKDEMPNFEKKITSEEDRWLLVNYIRTLAE